MSVTSIGAYRFAPADRVENFHGNQLLAVVWEDHLMFCAPIVVPVPPDLPWAALTGDLLPGLYAQHPDWARVDIGAIIWTLEDTPFTPDPALSLAAQGVGHKALLRFRTPGLSGLSGAHF